MADTSDTASHSSRYSPFSTASASASDSRVSDDDSTDLVDPFTGVSAYDVTTLALIYGREHEASYSDVDLDGDLDLDEELDLDEDLELGAHAYDDIEVDVGLDTDEDESEHEDIDIGSATDIDINESVDIDEDEEDEGEDEGEGAGEGAGGQNPDNDFYDGDDLNAYDFDMRDFDLDAIDGLDFLANEAAHYGFDDYWGVPGDDSLNTLRQTLIQYQLEHQLAVEPWSRPRSPPGEQPVGGARALLRLGRDQLVQIEMEEQGHGMNASAGAAIAGAAAGSRPRQGQRQQNFPDIIDLTGDDEVTMPRPARSVPARSSENPRRQRSQTQNAPPRLNRSDGNYVDDQHIIILSSSDDEDRPMRASPRRHAQLGHNNHGRHPPDQHRFNRHQENHNAGRGTRNGGYGDQSRQPGPASATASAAPATHVPSRNFAEQLMQRIPIFQFLNTHQPINHPAIMANRNANYNHNHNHNHNHGPDDEVVITGERNLVGVGLPPLPQHAHAPNRHFFNLGPNFGHIQLDYAIPPPPQPGPPAAAAGPTKPVHEPPPPARDGFTRDTGEEVVAICPSCDQELAYDPDDDDKTTAAPAKKSRAKNATAEHHFWAVKACGHVYCKQCFDNRRPTAKSTVHVNFRPSSDGSKKILCAVEDCDSEVSTKTAWVGIFM